MFKNKKRNLFVLFTSFLVVLTTIVFLPFVSIKYDSARIYLQILILASSSSLCFLVFLKNKIKVAALYLLTIFFILYFLFSSGFIGQLIGGPGTTFKLNQEGIEFSRYYSHSEEVAAGRWIFSEMEDKRLYVDGYANTKLYLTREDYNVQIIRDVLPRLISRDSYVYLNYLNKIEGITYKSYEKVLLSFEFPNDFLE
jgi:uncharacterized membrane protein